MKILISVMTVIVIIL